MLGEGEGASGRVRFPLGPRSKRSCAGLSSSSDRLCICQIKQSQCWYREPRGTQSRPRAQAQIPCPGTDGPAQPFPGRRTSGVSLCHGNSLNLPLSWAVGSEAPEGQITPINMRRDSEPFPLSACELFGYGTRRAGTRLLFCLERLFSLSALQRFGTRRLGSGSALWALARPGG